MTVGAPGTGLFYTDFKRHRSHADNAGPSYEAMLGWLIAIVRGVYLVSVFFS
jgi:hypothetical protein